MLIFSRKQYPIRGVDQAKKSVANHFRATSGGGHTDPAGRWNNGDHTKAGPMPSTVNLEGKVQKKTKNGGEQTRGYNVHLAYDPKGNAKLPDGSRIPLPGGGPNAKYGLMTNGVPDANSNSVVAFPDRFQDDEDDADFEFDIDSGFDEDDFEDADDEEWF